MKKLLILLLFVLPYFGISQNKYSFQIDTIYEVVFSENYTPIQALTVFTYDYELTELNRNLDVKTCNCVILENVWINTTNVPIVWSVDLKRKKFDHGIGYQKDITYSKIDKDVVHIRYEETYGDINFVINLFLYSEILFIHGKRLDSNGNLVNYFYTSIITYR
jgi:hypothetical protein